MNRNDKPISDEVARVIWRRAAELQAAAERRMEERARQLSERTGSAGPAGDEIHPDDVRAAAIEAGISAEFVEIAMAEAAASGSHSTRLPPWELLGAKLFLDPSQRSIELTGLVPGVVDAVTTAVAQVFSGHPCLLHVGEVADLPGSSGRVVVFNVPKYDWSATANPGFVEKTSMVGLRQLHVAVRPFSGDTATCEVVVTGDLHPGMRMRWRLGAVTSAGAGAAGGGAGVGIAGSALSGALLLLPALAGAAAVTGLTVALWGIGYRYYRTKVEESLKESLGLLEASARAMSGARISGDTRTHLRLSSVR
jgi:hypothetical protein